MSSLLQNVWDKILTKLSDYSPSIITTLVTLTIGYFVIRIIVHVIEKFFDKVNFDRAVETFIENAAKVVLWIILLINLIMKSM